METAVVGCNRDLCLNMTGLIDPTLKHVAKFRLR